jgi:hypothetical protein
MGGVPSVMNGMGGGGARHWSVENNNAAAWHQKTAPAPSPKKKPRLESWSSATVVPSFKVSTSYKECLFCGRCFPPKECMSCFVASLSRAVDNCMHTLL